MPGAIAVARRFNGPPSSGNGGYTAGLIAGVIGEPIAVRLHQPVPLERELRIAEAGERWTVRDGEELIATATRTSVAVEVPRPPSFSAAVASSTRYVGFKDHGYPDCFVCGPNREPHDGLRVFPGAVANTSVLAAPWTPDATLDDGARRLRAEHMWAALDCPGFFATLSTTPALLGELAVRIDRVVRIDEPCVVIAWAIAQEGRKHRAGTALFGESGELCAVGVATWIELKKNAGDSA